MKIQVWKHNLLLILLGNALIAVAGGVFILPNEIVSGGVNGVSLVLQPLVHIPVQVLIYMIIGISFVAGYVFMGRNFAAKH